MRQAARAMLAGDLANPGEEALGGRAAAGVGADAAGRGRKRSSSSRLTGAAPANQHKTMVKLAAVPRKTCECWRFAQGAALCRLLDGAAPPSPNQRADTIFARDGQRWCHPL